ncbi:hypothetical protein DW091_17760 [Eubacterium sp. AM05-23]|uniref:beta strand repeat-containing protein n=1 Tax=Eubacterium TaxID=1730 RepID=UPI000E4741B7|nr:MULTISPECIES: hypothetical protein [Eubacterium]RHO54359.1 hypothetical protein DW091_17760 [Eubacterium sp. AM05-23]
MSPTVKTTLTKTLILVFFALTAFFVLPGGVLAEEKIVGAFTVTGGQQDTDYTYADNTLTVNTGAVLTIKNTDSTTSTADKIVVMSGVTANITLDGVKIDVSSNENSCAFAVKSGAKLNLTLAAGSENSLKSGANCAGLNVPKDAELTIGSEGANPGSLTAQCGGNIRKFPYGAGIGGGKEEGSGIITINGGTVSAYGDGSNERFVNVYGAGIGGGGGGAGGTVTITGGTVSAYGNRSNQTGGVAYGAGIGGGYLGAGGTVTITGGSVQAIGGDGAENIGKGKNGTGSGTLTDGNNNNVSLVTLTVNGADSQPMATQAIDTLTVGGYTGDATAAAAAKKYGIKDVSTDAEGKLYLYLPAGDPTEGGLAYATLKDDATNTLYAGSVTGTDGNRSATLAPIDGNIDMSAIGGNLYIWNDGFMYGTAADEAAKIPYNGNYTLTGTTTANGVAVMPGYDGKTDGQDGYKTITLNNLNIDVSGYENHSSYAFLLGNPDRNTNYNNVVANLMLASGSKNSLISADMTAGLTVLKGASLKLDSTDTNPGSLTAESRGYIVVDEMESPASASGIGDCNYGYTGGLIRIDGGEITAGNKTSTGSGIGGENVIITGGSVTAISGSGAGIGGRESNKGCNVTISGGSVKAISNNGGAGIGGGSWGAGGTVIITGGSVQAIGGAGAEDIGKGKLANDSGTLKNAVDGADVSLVTLTVKDKKDTAIDTLQIGNRTGVDKVPTDTIDVNTQYGIHDVTTDTEGKLYLYLPADATSQAVSTGATLSGDATKTLYAGSVTETDSRSAALAPFDGAIDMSATGGNAYIWNDGFMYGTSADENAKIPYSGNYTLSGGTAETAIKNTVTVMPGYNGGTVGQSGKTITLNGLNIDVSDNENSCAFTLKGKDSGTPGASVNLMLAANSANSLKSGRYCAGLNVPGGVSLTIDSDNTNPGSLTAQSSETDNASHGAGIGGGNREACGTITINGGTVTTCSNSGEKDAYGAGIGGGYSGAGGTVTITGGTVTACSNSGKGKAYGAGIGGGFYGDGGDVTITGGTVTACSGKDTKNARGAGIGGGRDGAGRNVTITGGSVKAIGGDSSDDIGHGRWGSDSGTLTDGKNNLTLNTLTVGEPAVGDNVAIASTVADTPQTLSNGYGVKDVKTMDGGKVYFYLPDAAGPAAAIEVKAGTDPTVYSRSYDRANPETTGGSYDRAKAYTATLLPPASYTITIPETANFGDVSYQAGSAEQYKSQPLTVSGQNFTNLSDGRSLSLRVSGSGQSGAFALANGQNSLGYEVYKGETAIGSPLATGGRLAENWETSTEGTPQKALLRLDQSQIKYSGQYKGSLVFTVEMNDDVPLKE